MHRWHSLIKAYGGLKSPLHCISTASLQSQDGVLLFTDDVGRGEMRSSSHWRADGTQLPAAETQKDETRIPKLRGDFSAECNVENVK